MRNAIYFILIVLTMMGCSEPLTMEDNETTVEYSINTPFEVKLRTNPSTGYDWQILSYDTNVISQTADPEYDIDNDKVGAASTVTYKFVTKSAGNTMLRMIYTRNGEEEKSFSVNIISGTVGRITAD